MMSTQQKHKERAVLKSCYYTHVSHVQINTMRGFTLLPLDTRLLRCLLPATTPTTSHTFNPTFHITMTSPGQMFGKTKSILWPDNLLILTQACIRQEPNLPRAVKQEQSGEREDKYVLCRQEEVDGEGERKRDKEKWKMFVWANTLGMVLHTTLRWK